MVSAPEELDEGPDVSIEPKGCQHLEEHEPRQAGDLEDLDVDEDCSCSPCTVWGRHEDLETPKVPSS